MRWLAVVFMTFAAAGAASAQPCVDRRPIVVEYGIDLSGSMAGARQQAAGNFAVALFDQLNATGFLNSVGDFAFSDCILASAAPNTNLPGMRADLALTNTARTDLACFGGANTFVYDAIVAGTSVIYAQPSSLTRLYVVLTDGEDGGSSVTPAGAASHLPPGVFTELILIANPGDPGDAGLHSIASAAGSHVRARATTDLLSIVSSIVDRTCANFRPTAAFSMSDSELHLGTEGFQITFNGSASTDRDGTIAQFRWHFTRPDGSTSDQTGNPITVTFDDSQLTHGENWSVQLIVRDNAGAEHSVSQPFRIIGSPPNVSIAGPTALDVLQPLQLTVSPATDIDGGMLTFSWDIVTSPSGSTHGPVSAFATTAATPVIDTVETDIGNWTFRVTATDNEGQTDVENRNVEVRNLPPEIHLSGQHTIRPGETISIATSDLTDRDGGTLDFRWDVLQSPNPSGVPPQEGYFTGSGAAGATLTIPTNASHAGSWIFRLTATDNDHAANSSVHQDFDVLVDAPPQANITGPDRIGSLSFPLEMHGGGSTDPDSAVPHSRLDGGMPVLSGGITSYTWRLFDVPFDHFTEYVLGPLDESLGIAAHSQNATIDHGLIETGEWTFDLEVTDAEHNSDSTTWQVTVVDENGPPFALSSGPARYLVNGVNALLGDVTVSGGASFDLDNFLSSGTIGPGVGITNYAWSVSHAPPGCTPPALSSGSSAQTVTVFSSGTVIDSACLGLWEIALTVTDDDAPTARTATTTSQFIIGNCPQTICIDYPTTIFPQMIEFTDATDVLIYYHVDAGIYSNAAFIGGVFAQLEVIKEGESTPFFTDFDPNPLGSSVGGFTVFHWNGFGNLHQRPTPGRYTVRITLVDAAFTGTTTTAQETNSIQIATAEAAILPTSDKLASVDAFTAGTAVLHLNYQVTGGAHPDQITLRILDAASHAVMFTRTDAFTGPMGTITWDGHTTPMMFAPPGAYEAEIDAVRMGAALSTSVRYPFMVVRTDIDVDTDRDGTVADTADDTGEETWVNARGAIFSVNYDADGSRMSGGVPIPDALGFDDNGVPINEHMAIENAADALDITPVVLRGLGTGLPAGVHVFLEVPDLEDIQSIHVYKRIAAGEAVIWGGVGSRVAPNPPQPLEKDITDLIDPTSATFAGVMPSGDVTLGLEGLFFRNTGVTNPFDGDVDITLEFRDGATVLFSDVVRLKVAPWLMLPHTQASTEIWVRDRGALNDAFRLTASAGAGYKGLDHSAQLHAVAGGTSNTQWFQDHIETGYYQRPGGPKTVMTFRLPYHRTGSPPQPDWPVNNLLHGDFGIFQIGEFVGPDNGSAGGGSGSYGGNLEVMPPTPAHALGRIVIGDARSDELLDFLTSQEVQPPVEIPTQWLSVGHVDEMVAFDTAPARAIIADPSDAWAIMTAIPAADRGRSVFFATGALQPQSGTVSAAPVAPNRLETGIDLTGTTWNFVRIYESGASGAAGQVAHISSRGIGFIEVDQVWDTGTKIIHGGGAVTTILDTMFTPAIPTATWARPPAGGDKYVLVEGTRFWKDTTLVGVDGTPSIVTVQEILADADLHDLNLTDAQGRLTATRTALDGAAGVPLSYVSVPVIYVGERAGFATGRSAIALTPGLNNVQQAATTLFFPRQFSPRNAANEDLFEKTTKMRLPAAEFVDDWNLYHRWEGEVHCGSAVVRVPLAIDWWTVLP